MGCPGAGGGGAGGTRGVLGQEMGGSGETQVVLGQEAGAAGATPGPVRLGKREGGDSSTGDSREAMGSWRTGRLSGQGEGMTWTLKEMESHWHFKRSL